MRQEAARQEAHDTRTKQKAWKKWVRDAFQNGAGIAHRCAKLPGPVDKMPAMVYASPHGVADRELHKWSRVWRHHEAP
eukprot:1133860-Pyramimonas_sp.AAC.1